jgi:hypothetical protein
MNKRGKRSEMQRHEKNEEINDDVVITFPRRSGEIQR